MQRQMPGERVDQGPYVTELDFSGLQMRVATDRYSSREYHDREKERLWMRVWQVAGRADELPQAGDWKVHAIFDQSYVLVRCKDGVIRLAYFHSVLDSWVEGRTGSTPQGA